jgi:uncharacterized protein
MVKDMDETQGILMGYFSSYDNTDSDGDIIRYGAYKKSIEERGPNSANPRIKHLMNHDISIPIGKLLILEEQEGKGLYYESKLGTHKAGKDMVEMVKSGLITEHSVGFKAIQYKEMDNGLEFTEVKLWEGSTLTGWGANEVTPLIGMKSEDRDVYIQKLNEQIKRVEKFCKHTDASDELIDLLLIQVKQMQSSILQLIDTKVVNPTPAPSKDELAQKAAAYLELVKLKIS